MMSAFAYQSKRLLKILSLKSQLKNKGTWILAFVLLAINITAVVVSRHSGQLVVSFDKGFAIAEFAKSMNKKAVSLDKQSMLVSSFVHAMNETLRVEALNRRLVILNGKEVLSGTRDVTKEFLPLIAKRMQATRLKNMGDAHEKG